MIEIENLHLEIIRMIFDLDGIVVNRGWVV